MVRTCLTPEAGQPEHPVSAMSILCSSALSRALYGAVGSHICLEKLPADNIQPQMGKGSGKRQEAQAPSSLLSIQQALCLPAAFVMRIQVIRKNSSGQETQTVSSPSLLGKKFCACAVSGSSQCRQFSVN